MALLTQIQKQNIVSFNLSNHMKIYVIWYSQGIRFIFDK